MDEIKIADHGMTASANRPSYYGVHHLALDPLQKWG